MISWNGTAYILGDAKRTVYLRTTGFYRGFLNNQPIGFYRGLL